MSAENNHTALHEAYTHGSNQVQKTVVNGVEVILAPNNLKMFDLQDIDDRTRERPRFLSQVVETHSAESFINYFNRFANKDSSAIFIDRITTRFTGIIDYHNSSDEPARTLHRVIYNAPKTDAANKWLGNNNEKMSQEDFALFIEDSQREILEPNAAEMLEIAASLKSTKNVDFKSGIRLDNGQVQFQYTETLNGQAGVNGQLSIPEKIKLALTIYKGGAPYEMEARFRYRITPTGLCMWYTLISPELYINDAIDDIEKVVTEKSVTTNIYQGTTK